MPARTALALCALLALVAFAPAPFPRAGRQAKSDAITLSSFQGRWRVVKMQSSRADGQHQPYSWNVTHIRVVQDRWTFMADQSEVSSWGIDVDHAQRPVHLHFYGSPQNKTSLAGVGLMRWHQGQLQVMYTWGGEASRPKSFDPPPSGPWIITMVRD